MALHQATSSGGDTQTGSGDGKRILFLTATRADFGKLQSLIQHVEEDPELESYIFATGMHTLARYGSTYHEIEKAGFGNLFLHFNQMENTSGDMDIVLANTIYGLGHYVREIRVDMIVVHGDRVETLAGAIVGALNNILVAHVEGGERSGTVDELLRHAVTKLAQIHFVANEESRNRVIQLGEAPESVFIIGSPDIDIMLSDDLPSLAIAREWYDIPFDEYGIFCYHPVTTERDELPANIANVVEALEAADLNFVVIYPNNDAGSDVIMRSIRRLSGNPRFRLLPSARFRYFLTLLKHAKVMVGNSSAGVREAPVYGVPAVNIGTRQQDRFDGTSVINVSENREEILGVLRNIPERTAPCMHFGTGDSGRRFVERLRGPEVWTIPVQKRFRDILGGWKNPCRVPQK
jgi:UDP-N-acetylglucosamine 2-epimerase (hydrolysing)